MISKVGPCRPALRGHHFLVSSACPTGAGSLTKKLTQSPFPQLLLAFYFLHISQATAVVLTPSGLQAAVSFPRDFLSPAWSQFKGFELVQECLPLTSSLPGKEFNFLRICVCDSR